MIAAKIPNFKSLDPNSVGISVVGLGSVELPRSLWEKIEAMAPAALKDMILASQSADIIRTPNVTGIDANILRQSLKAHGLVPFDFPTPADFPAS